MRRRRRRRRRCRRRRRRRCRRRFRRRWPIKCESKFNANINETIEVWLLFLSIFSCSSFNSLTFHCIHCWFISLYLKWNQSVKPLTNWPSTIENKKRFSDWSTGGAQTIKSRNRSPEDQQYLRYYRVPWIHLSGETAIFSLNPSGQSYASKTSRDPSRNDGLTASTLFPFLTHS